MSHPTDPAENEPIESPARTFNWQPWLNLFYSILLGIAAGSVIAKLWRSGGELPDTLPPVAELTYQLSSDQPESDSGTWSSVRALSDVKAHADGLSRLYLGQLGLPAELGLLSVTIANYESEPLAIDDREGSLELLLASGETISSLPLPRSTNDPNGRLRLAQAVLEGELSPASYRTGWKLLPRPVDLAEVKSGAVVLPSGERIALKQVTR